MMGSVARQQWAGRHLCAVEQRQGKRKVKEGWRGKRRAASRHEKETGHAGRRGKNLGGLRRFRLR
jgi:hypothetical protein